MLDFPTKTLESIKKLLLRQEKEIEENIKEIEEDDPAKDNGVAESSEPGTDSYIAEIHTKNIVLEQHLKSAKTNIKDALTKIKNGTYGKCEKCGNRIELSRLLAMPTAKYCLSCTKKTAKT